MKWIVFTNFLTEYNMASTIYIIILLAHGKGHKWIIMIFRVPHGKTGPYY